MPVFRLPYDLLGLFESRADVVTRIVWIEERPAPETVNNYFCFAPLSAALNKDILGIIPEDCLAYEELRGVGFPALFFWLVKAMQGINDVVVVCLTTTHATLLVLLT